MKRRSLRWLVAIAAIITLTISVACGEAPPEQFSQAGGDYTASACHIVIHAAGETCVPNNPQRIVDLAGLDYAFTRLNRKLDSSLD